MNIQQLLISMQKQHKDVSNNLDKLENLKLICNTDMGTDKDKKNFNKLLKQTKKLYSTLSMSYKMVTNQKLNFPKEMKEIGLEIEEFKNRLENLKEF